MLQKILLTLLVCLTLLAAVADESAKEDFEFYKKSSSANPRWDPFIKEGFDAYDRQDLTTTLDFLRKATNLGCKSPIVLFKMALTYEAQGSLYTAIQYYELAEPQFKIMTGDHRYKAQFDENYGRALFLMDQKEKAMVLLERASATSQNPWVLRLVANMYLSKGDANQAVTHFERLFNLKEASVEAKEKIDILTQLARLYRNQKDEENTKKYYHQVLSQDPNNPEAKGYLQQIQKEKTKTGSSEKVMEMLDKF